jgi:hypothetical protein
MLIKKLIKNGQSNHNALVKEIKNFGTKIDIFLNSKQISHKYTLLSSLLHIYHLRELRKMMGRNAT